MPVIALLTDFGTDDHYVGTMKGVMLSIAPDVTLVDITHGIAPQDILGGALQLAAAYRYFPEHTIFLAVVDPGVGSGRRALAARAGGFTFVAPDNGLLTAVFDEARAAVIVELHDPKYALPRVSRTFEGRDRFAPAAAWIARGVAIEALGPAAPDVVRLEIPRPRSSAEALSGEVLYADRFGNLVTNITSAAYAAFLGEKGGTISAGPLPAVALATSYAAMPEGVVCAIFGSSDRLELSVRGSSAASRLAAGRGLPVSLRRAR